MCSWASGSLPRLVLWLVLWLVRWLVPQLIPHLILQLVPQLVLSVSVSVSSWGWLSMATHRTGSWAVPVRFTQTREFLDLVHTSLGHTAVGLLWMRVAEPDAFVKRVKNTTM